MGKKFFNVFYAVNDLDHDRQIGGQVDKAGRVDATVGAISHATLEYGCSGEIKFFCFENQCSIERFSLPGIGFPDVDSKTLGMSLNFWHFLSPLKLLFDLI